MGFKTSARPVLRAMQWCSGLTIIYVAVIFLLPNSSSSLMSMHLDSIDFNVVTLIAAIPSIIVWFIAFWGYTKLRAYAQAIKKTKEGPHFNRLATGITWLAWSLPITAIISHTLDGIANKHVNFHPSAIIISNYADMLLPLIAFIIIASAAKGILGSTGVDLGKISARIIMVVFVIAGVSYCSLTLRAFDLTSLSSTDNPYFLPAWLMVLTLIIPFLYSWFIGLLAAYEITLSAYQTKGILYKRALFFLVAGLVAIIVSSIIVQYLNSVLPSTGHLVINYKTLVVIGFRVIDGIGFILLTIGANRLKKIEEV